MAQKRTTMATMCRAQPSASHAVVGFRASGFGAFRVEGDSGSGFILGLRVSSPWLVGFQCP